MEILGIDIGGTKILGLRADEHGKVLDEVMVLTHAEDGVEPVIGRVVEVIRRLMPPGGVQAIGIGTPGPIDPVKGEVYEPPNLPGWKDVPLRRRLEEKLAGLQAVVSPIVLVNDANAAALAEFKFGAGSEARLGRKIKNLVYLTISTGIGGGVIADARLLLGANGYAAELGHMTIDAFGRRCRCGNIGCLEEMASGTALANEARRVLELGHKSMIAELVQGDLTQVSARTVVEAARQGDPLACELIEREGMLVGVGVVTCVHIFNPELVVLGGGVSNAGDLLLDPVRATVNARVMPAYRGTFEIVTAALKDESGALGAVAAALEAVEDGHA